MLAATTVQDGEERLAHHRYEAVQARAEIGDALGKLAAAQNQLLALKLEHAVEAQRSVELEALGFCKSVNALHQRAAKWKAEQKRLRNALEGMDKFEDWAAAVETDLQSIAGNLEYACFVLEKEREESSATPAGAGPGAISS
ncbi:hypothetical protein PybrP1_004356 [[Pythium] brassicae (nom. inval.)]|nr:hypothetical protein PybrP1_004356 [[Pythium] brassicae (nom. inval.)]